MNDVDQTTMGKKGEILPKLPLREISGIQPGDKIEIHAHPGELIIKKILSIEEALALPTIAKHTATEAEDMINMESKRQEELVD